MPAATKPLKRRVLRPLEAMHPVRTNGFDKPIVAIDIDGTMGDYHGHFLAFAERWFGKPMPNADQINPGLNLYKFMGVTKASYREAKLAFRQGGWKRWMPVYPWASWLTENIQSAGAEVWICTTRPYLRLDSIDPDTREWLRRNGIQYNAVLFGDDKYTELKRQAGARVAAILDDLPEMLTRAADIGFKPLYIRNQPYNQDYMGRAHRFNDLNAVSPDIMNDIETWKERHK